jgi:hypothetical protein
MVYFRRIGPLILEKKHTHEPYHLCWQRLHIGSSVGDMGWIRTGTIATVFTSSKDPTRWIPQFFGSFTFSETQIIASNEVF